MAGNLTSTELQPSPLAQEVQALWGRYREKLFASITPAPLAYFRIVFGAVMLWEVSRYLRYDWVERYYIDPEFLFTYPGFGWLQPWPEGYMYVHFLVLGLLAGCIMLGLFYRVATVLFFLGFTYVFLLDQANYLNHFYLISLISLLMIFIPAHRAVSLDVVRRPDLQAAEVPAWSLWLLRFQIAVPYFFGGIAKLNADWLNGEPMRMWLARGTDVPIIGPFLTEPWAAYFFSYSGLLFDLLVVPLLLWRRTRLLGFAMALGFHLMNANLFSIGIFPWFMIGATVLFFPPERLQFVDRLQPWLGEPASPSPSPEYPSDRARKLVPILLAVWIACQVLIPFRHLLYPGNVSWTEEGHNFSWHMKLRDKVGRITFFATEPISGETQEVDYRGHLSPRQQRKMVTRPDMILLFSRYLETELQRQTGLQDFEVRVHSEVSLNGRPYQVMIDSGRDLTQVRRSISPADWILPLDMPLEGRDIPGSERIDEAGSDVDE